jgi:serine-type D-Ala-D-Ala carboxypeptidase (penicillin-binding protein 5/6)
MDKVKIKYLLLALFPLIVFIVLKYSISFFGYQSLVTPFLGPNKSTSAKNIWFPKNLSKDDEVSDYSVEITAKSALFVEINSGEVLYYKNPDERLRIASLKKIMTAIVTLENRNLDDLLTVSERAASFVPDKMYLRSGEKLTVRELLQGLFLVSANDAAEVLAERVLSSRSKFIGEMNNKALELGMNNTLFINPSGLEEDDPDDESKLIEHYSTALDVLLMSRYAIKKWPILVDEITSKTKIEIPATDTHKAYTLETGINLVPTNPEVLGFKTGYTPEAGLTLATYAKKGDKEIIGILLGSTKRRDDARALIEYSFNKLGIK